MLKERKDISSDDESSLSSAVDAALADTGSAGSTPESLQVTVPSRRMTEFRQQTSPVAILSRVSNNSLIRMLLVCSRQTGVVFRNLYRRFRQEAFYNYFSCVIILYLYE